MAQWADFLLTVYTNQKKLHWQICDQLRGKPQIPFLATDHEISHRRDITWNLLANEAPEHIKTYRPGSAWILDVIASGIRDGKSFKFRHLFNTSLRTIPDVILHLVWERWSIESWHYVCDTDLQNDRHRMKLTEPASWLPCALHR